MDPSSAPWRALEPAEPNPPALEPQNRAISWMAVAIVLAVAGAALAAFLLASHPGTVITIDGAAARDTGSAAVGAPDGSAGVPRDEIVVEVGGAVARPGLYRLPQGSRIGDAITAAGGYGPRVDAVAADARLNLAELLHDGDEVHVPGRDEVDGGASVGSTPPAGGGGAGLVDLNSASAEQLDTLPGVGPATAAKILAARQERRFSSVDELGSRGVVGTATLAKIRPLATVGP